MMRQNKIYLCTLVVLLLISGICIWNTVSQAANQNHLEKTMLNDIYSKLNSVSYHLDDVLIQTDTQASNGFTPEESLTYLAGDFLQLHTTLKYYAISFPPKGVSRTSYAGLIDFEHIAYKLIAGTGTVNTNAYNGILEDGYISEDEIKFLTILRDDINIIVESMTSTENPLQEKSDLTATQMDNILNVFFSKWSWHEENSPFFLLCK